MMIPKIEVWNGLNGYSCQVCGFDFETPEEHYIIPYFSPVCSKWKCRFNQVFRVFATYPNSLIKAFWMHSDLGEMPKKRQEAIYKLSKKMMGVRR